MASDYTKKSGGFLFVHLTMTSEPIRPPQSLSWNPAKPAAKPQHHHPAKQREGIGVHTAPQATCWIPQRRSFHPSLPCIFR